MSKFKILIALKNLKSQIAIALGKIGLQLLLLLAVYQIIRILFLAINYNYFSDISFVECLKTMFFGIRFDLSALLIINSLYFILSTLPFGFIHHKAYNLLLTIIFVVFNLVGVVFNLIDIPYFQISHKRITFDFLSVVADSSNSSLLYSYLKTYWYLFVVLFVFFIVLKTIASLKYQQKFIETRKQQHWFFKFLCFVFVCVSIFVGARGGSQMRPITIANAAEYTNSNYIPLVLNSAFTFINTSTNEKLEVLKYYDDSSAEKIYSPIHFLNHNKPFVNKNVVLIVLESFGKEHVGYFNGNKKSTPFFDSLMQHSTVFVNGFANATRSIEGIPAILASIPNLADNAFITSSYSSNQITSIASLLHAKGYNSTFYHGGRNGTMSFDAFTKLCGFQKYYGLNEYENKADFDGHWGIWDEPYLQYFAKELSVKQQPFFSTVFTLSSHDPYLVPTKYKNVFREGTVPIEKTIAYTDHALKLFFEKIKNQSWFKNTLFVFVADHTSNSSNPIFQNSYGYHKIPIVFYEANNAPKICKTITQQIDILPNIMQYLNYDQSYFSFGKPTIDNANNNVSMNYVNGVYETFNDTQLVKFDKKKTVAVFNLKTDSLLQNSVLGSQKISMYLINYTKAYLQSYTHCISENKMTVENYFRTTTTQK